MSGKSIFLNNRFSAAVSDRDRKEKRRLSTQHQMLYVKEPGKCSLYISRSIAELRVEMFMRFLQIPYSMQADMEKSQSSF